MTATSVVVRNPLFQSGGLMLLRQLDRHTEAIPGASERTRPAWRQRIHAIYNALGGLNEQRHVRMALEIGVAGKQFSAVVSRRRVDNGIRVG